MLILWLPGRKIIIMPTLKTRFSLATFKLEHRGETYIYGSITHVDVYTRTIQFYVDNGAWHGSITAEGIMHIRDSPTAFRDGIDAHNIADGNYTFENTMLNKEETDDSDLPNGGIPF